MQRDAPAFTTLPPLSLYVHIPWCVRKCPYCDFNSHAAPGGDTLPERDYVAALMADLECQLPRFWGRTVHTVFIGGGTPSLFSAQAIAELIAGVRARTRLAPGAEITLEANPGTFEQQKFAGFADAGVTRLSIGVQSFSDARLRALGRIHDGNQARRAIEIGLNTIGNVNLDLMFALPAVSANQAAQSMQECAADLEAALSFAPPHLSLYQLTIEPNTVFAKTPPRLPEHDLAADMQAFIEERLVAAGYEHYETSAYAKPGRRCQHNLNYWGFGDYVGIGAGAHGKLTLPGAAGVGGAGPRIVRSERVKTPREYLRFALSETPERCVHEEHDVAASEVGFEFMLNALRLTDGFPVAWFAERTGYPMTIVDAALADAEAERLIERDGAVIRPTPLGRRFLNRILTRLLPT